MTPIRFHFDFISPYAYLGWCQIHTLAARCQATVEPSPVLFAALLNHHGHKGPAEIEPKRVYVLKDTARRARLLGVPFEPPPSHPFNPLLALRAVLAAPAASRRAVIDGLFAATWGTPSAAGAPKRGVDHAETVAQIATVVGLDADDLLTRAQDPEVKANLRERTELAIRAGVFGVPTVQVGDELFFGLDSFDLLELHLNGQDPLPLDLVDRFRDLPASARR